MGQVRPQVGGPLQEHVEGEEVEPRQRQVLGRRVVAVGHEPVGVLVPDSVGQFGDHRRHPAGPHEAHHVARHLVADAQTHDGFRGGQVPGRPAHRHRPGPGDLAALPAGGAQKVAPVGPVDTGEQVQPRVGGEFDDVGRRFGVRPDNGEAGVRDVDEVPLDPIAVRVAGTVVTGLEGPVGHTGKAEPLTPEGEEFSVDRDSAGGCRPSISRMHDHRCRQALQRP
jgi:hypothetical protein